MMCEDCFGVAVNSQDYSAARSAYKSHYYNGYRFNLNLQFSWFLHVIVAWSDMNWHGPQLQTIKGWKFAKPISMGRQTLGKSWRLILYKPDGSWYHADLYVTISRRHKTWKSLIKALRRPL